MQEDVEIEEGDKKGSTTEDLLLMSGEFLYRLHEKPRVKLYDPDNETFTIQLKYVHFCETKLRRV